MGILEKSDAREVLRGLIACENRESKEFKNIENELKVEISDSTEVKYDVTKSKARGKI